MGTMARISDSQDRLTVATAFADGLAAADWLRSDPEQPYDLEFAEEQSRIQTAVKDALGAKLQDDETLVCRIAGMAVRVSDAVTEGRNIIVGHKEIDPQPLSAALYELRSSANALNGGDTISPLGIASGKLLDIIENGSSDYRIAA